MSPKLKLLSTACIFALISSCGSGSGDGANADGTCNEGFVNSYNTMASTARSFAFITSRSEFDTKLSSLEADINSFEAKYAGTVCRAYLNGEEATINADAKINEARDAIRTAKSTLNSSSSSSSSSSSASSNSSVAVDQSVNSKIEKVMKLNNEAMKAHTSKEIVEEYKSILEEDAKSFEKEIGKAPSDELIELQASIYNMTESKKKFNEIVSILNDLMNNYPNNYKFRTSSSSSDIYTLNKDKLRNVRKKAESQLEALTLLIDVNQGRVETKLSEEKADAEAKAKADAKAEKDSQ